MSTNPRPRPPKALRFLALGAFSLGFFAIFAESPTPFTVTVDLQDLAGSIEKEEDHFSASELAHLIMRRSNRLRVVDVRDTASFEQYHIPGAARYDLPSLLRARFTPKDTIVIYSDGGIHASQAWFLLRMRGLENTYTLLGGMDFWKDQVLHPSLSAATPQAIRDSVGRIAAFFGGAVEEHPELRQNSTPPGHSHKQPVRFERERERTRDGC